MGTIKREIRNIRFGTNIRSVLMPGEKLMYQRIMYCSTNKGKFWCTAVVGLTNKRFIVEWQRSRGKPISVEYSQILSWNVTKDIGGLSGIVGKVLPTHELCMDININEDTCIRISEKEQELQIFINHWKQYMGER